MSSTAFIEPLPVIDFVNQLLNRDVSSRPLSDADRVKVRSVYFYFIFFWVMVISFILFTTTLLFLKSSDHSSRYTFIYYFAKLLLSDGTIYFHD